MLVYSGQELIPCGYTESDFQSDKDERKSTSGVVFTLNCGAVEWRSIKQGCISDSIMEATYIDTVMARFSMQDSKKGSLPYRHGIYLSMEQSPKTPQEQEDMRDIPYASAVGSLMYAMLCTRPDICYSVGVASRFQSNPGPEHWIAVKCILKYLRRTRNFMLVYSGQELIPYGYTDSDFQSDKDQRKSTDMEFMTTFLRQ